MNLNREMTNRRLNVAQVGWPLADLGAGMDTLARRTGLDPAAGEPSHACVVQDGRRGIVALGPVGGSKACA